MGPILKNTTDLDADGEVTTGGCLPESQALVDEIRILLQDILTYRSWAMRGEEANHSCDTHTHTHTHTHHFPDFYNKNPQTREIVP